MKQGAALRCGLALLVVFPALVSTRELRNHMEVMAARQEPANFALPDDSESEKNLEQKSFVKDDLATWWFWRPAVYGVGFLIFMCEIGAPVISACIKPTLMKEAAVFLLTMIGFAAVVLMNLDWKAAGMQILVGSAALGAAISILFFAMSLSIAAFTSRAKDPTKLVLTDMAMCLRGVARLVMLTTLMAVIANVAGVDWGRLAVLTAFLMLAVAFALSGVVSDILAHFFIRYDEHFTEGDFILFDGDLVQIEECHWRHTVGLSVPTQSIIYIPNSALTSSPLVNKTTNVKEELAAMTEELDKLGLTD